MIGWTQKENNNGNNNNNEDSEGGDDNNLNIFTVASNENILTWIAFSSVAICVSAQDSDLWTNYILSLDYKSVLHELDINNTRLKVCNSVI
jgi:hypothetical protein